MPGILDRSEQFKNELKTTAMFGEEIEGMNATDRKAALTDLLPDLEAATPLKALRDFNDKARKWIDQHPQP